MGCYIVPVVWRAVPDYCRIESQIGLELQTARSRRSGERLRLLLAEDTNRRHDNEKHFDNNNNYYYYYYQSTTNAPLTGGTAIRSHHMSKWPYNMADAPVPVPRPRSPVRHVARQSVSAQRERLRTPQPPRDFSILI
jgi:hypothetical protein